MSRHQEWPPRCCLVSPRDTTRCACGSSFFSLRSLLCTVCQQKCLCQRAAYCIFCLRHLKHNAGGCAWLGSSDDAAVAQMAIRMKTREDDPEADEKARGESSYKSPAKGMFTTHISCYAKRSACSQVARPLKGTRRIPLSRSHSMPAAL